MDASEAEDNLISFMMLIIRRTQRKKRRRQRLSVRHLLPYMARGVRSGFERL
jgi:hypothetical protein